MGKEEINSKDHLEYIDHQKIKTTDPVKIKKWQNEEWQIKLEGFKEIFLNTLHFLRRRKNAWVLDQELVKK